MQSPSQSASFTTRKFMCLEDRFLQALYISDGPVSLENLAAPISITPAAALSIAHRIQNTYPDYLQLEESGTLEDYYLSPSTSQITSVQAFLDNGGFTKINEQEFLRYYEKELKREKRQAFIQQYKEKIKREKWAIGITALVGMGIILATYFYKQRVQEGI